MSLSTKAILVSVKISQWAGRKLDKKATATVENSHSTEKKVGNYTKKLLPGAKELAEVTSQAQALRTFFYEETLPWCADGSRVLASKNYLEFVKAFTARRESLEQAISEFIAAYPSLQAQARAKLGNLYSDSEYPSVHELRDRFSCEIQFFPIPEFGDFRVQLSASEKATFEKQMKDAEAAAMKDCWKRLHEVVSKAAARLASPDAIVRDSLIENISECCTLLSRLNVTDDPTLESMRKEVEKVATKISPDSCRASDVSRTEAADKLAEITARMGAFMGK